MNGAIEVITVGIMCVPEEIANAVAFLESDKADYVTGQTLVANGGILR